MLASMGVFVLELSMSGPFLEGMWVKSVAVRCSAPCCKMLTCFFGGVGAESVDVRFVTVLWCKMLASMGVLVLELSMSGPVLERDVGEECRCNCSAPCCKMLTCFLGVLMLNLSISGLLWCKMLASIWGCWC